MVPNKWEAKRRSERLENVGYETYPHSKSNDWKPMKLFAFFHIPPLVEPASVTPAKLLLFCSTAAQHLEN